MSVIVMDHRPLDPPGIALYVHVPFCAARCGYCSFYSCTDLSAATGYVEAALSELDRLAPEIGLRQSANRRVDSVYLGGGTPTALPTDRLTRLLAGVLARTGPVGEVTVECNPGTVEGETLSALADAGLTRLSVGAQSFDDEVLAMLGRIHRAQDISRTVDLARTVGIGSVGLDLMYALPGQSVAGFEKSLRAALELSPDAVSVYALSYEPGTPMHRLMQRGAIRPLDESTDRALYDAAVSMLAGAGLPPYELSNHARPGHACRHNLHVWRGGWFVGLGPSACSFAHGVHTANMSDLSRYVERIGKGRSAAASRRRPTDDERTGELAVLSLRTAEGLNLARFTRQTGRDARALFHRSIAAHLAAGMLFDAGDRLILTRAARPVADGILADFSLPD